MMPDGLDVLAPYLLPILKQLKYLRPAQLAIGTGNKEPALESALQLYISNSHGASKEHHIQVVAV